MAPGWPVVSLGRECAGAGTGFRRGEYDPETLRSVPSWGLSVLLHALLILLLAIVIRRSRGTAGPDTSFAGAIVDTQLGDITSLVDATAGRRSVHADELSGPALAGARGRRPQLKLVGQPEIRSLNQFAPAFAAPTPHAGREERRRWPACGSPSSAMHVTAPFSGRQGLTRAKLVRREGGTAKSEKSVEDGLDWLVRHQRADGSWSLNYHEQCQANACPYQPA